MDSKPRLVLWHGGKEEPGSVTRLGLMEQWDGLSPRQIAWMIGTKCLLLAAALYVIYG